MTIKMLNTDAALSVKDEGFDADLDWAMECVLNAIEKGEGRHVVFHVPENKAARAVQIVRYLSETDEFISHVTNTGNLVIIW